MMVMMVVVMLVVVVMFMLLMVVMMMFFILVVIVVVVIVVIIVVIIIVFVFVMILYLVDPSGRCGHAVKVEQARVEEFLEGNIAEIAFYDFSFRLDGADNLTDASQLFFRHLCRLVKKNHVAELYLLDDEVLDVVFLHVLPQQVLAVSKLVAHAESVDNGHDVVEEGNAVQHILVTHRGD